jgi:hypothetical protein
VRIAGIEGAARIKDASWVRDAAGIAHTPWIGDPTRVSDTPWVGHPTRIGDPTRVGRAMPGSGTALGDENGQGQRSGEG